MYRINFVIALILINISSILSENKFNSSIRTSLSVLSTQEIITSSCHYCQTRTCRCSTMKKILNCSSYLLNLTYTSNCANNIIWDIVDFSSRNLEFLDSTKLLSLRMHRLQLKSNIITHIDENIFNSIGNILIELDLQMNRLSNLSSTWLNSKLTQLKILNLASNQLESFVHLNNIYLPYLKELNLSCNQIKIFPQQIYQWTSLMKLDLSFNKLSSIPRFAFRTLRHLIWLSLASNRNLTCIVQDSFKYLKSLKYLDLSSTNLFHLDGCIFIQLTGLQTLKVKRISINCSSCWISIAKKNSIKLFGQCFNNMKMQQLDSLTDVQLHNSCLKSSIDCSSDHCEPGSFNLNYKSFSFGKLSYLTGNLNESKYQIIAIILSIIFSIIIMVIIILIYRWKKNKSLLCCHVQLEISSTINAITKDYNHKQIMNSHPTIIESVITHGVNMNVSSQTHQNHGYSDEINLNNTRKLYNPMFNNCSKLEAKYHQSGRNGIE